MTAALLGFAVAGLLPEGRPARTLRWAAWLVVASSLLAAASPGLPVLLAARAAQGVGVGLLVAGGLADVPRRLPAGAAARVTGAMLGGTALGGLVSRLVGYSGILLGWRGAFLVGGAGVLLVVLPSLRALPLDAPARDHHRAEGSGGVPATLIAAGLLILFVSVGMFDLLPYRLAGPPFHLPPLLGDLVYLVFVPATFAAVAAGRAVDRFGRRAVILWTAAIAVALMLAGLVPALPALAAAAAGAICGTVSLHVAHSGAAAAHGRVAVGRYHAAYYVGGAAAAPLLAASFGRWGWPGVVLPLCGTTLVVACLAAVRDPAGVEPAGS